MAKRWEERAIRNLTDQPRNGKVTLFLLALSLTFPGIVYSSDCSCGFVDGQPSIASTLNPITIDGDMSDWGFFIADDDNNACDGPAANPGSSPDPWVDRDSQPVSEGRDLVQFTWTYDQTSLLLYTARSDSSSNNNVNKFVYYADIDNDGLMETGEPVIGAVWKGTNRNVDVSMGTYVAYAASGDATVDSLGFGDGYSMPGTVDKNSIYAVGSGAWGSTDGLSMEFAIDWWAHLGVAPGTGHSIHVSSANANLQQPSLPAQIDDNIGGCGGGVASTQFADLLFSGATSLQGARASSVYEFHHLVNTGNGDDSFAFAYTRTGTHLPSVTLYLDDGDAIYDTGDSVIPIAGTVAVASGASVDIIAVYGIGGMAIGLATIVIDATSEYDPAVADSVSDTVWVTLPDITTLKYVSSVLDAVAETPVGFDKALPGADITYTVTVNNSGDGYAEQDSVVVTDRFSPNTDFYIGAGAVSPVSVSEDTSTLLYSYSAGNLGSTTDDIDFTSENVASPAYTYTPVPDVDRYDSLVTGFRINPKGTFAAGTSFNFSYTVRIR